MQTSFRPCPSLLVPKTPLQMIQELQTRWGLVRGFSALTVSLLTLPAMQRELRESEVLTGWSQLPLLVLSSAQVKGRVEKASVVGTGLHAALDFLCPRVHTAHWQVQ